MEKFRYRLIVNLENLITLDNRLNYTILQSAQIQTVGNIYLSILNIYI